MIKILCLHGYEQNARVMYKKMGVLRKMLMAQVDFVYVDAPFCIKLESESESLPEDSKGRSWWLNKEGQGHEQTVTLLKRVWQDQGPFDGVFGFSQGAMLLSTLLHNPTDWPFKFAILVSGRLAPPALLPPASTVSALFQLPSLHIVGENDAYLPVEEAKQLAALFQHPDWLAHEGGHVIPLGASYRSLLSEFIHAHATIHDRENIS